MEKIQSLKLKAIKRPGNWKKIQADPWTAEIAESMKERGLFQPVRVRADMTIHMGKHRIAAAELLKWEEIPGIVTDVQGLAADIETLEENLRRQHMTPEEKAKVTAEYVKLLEAKAKADADDWGVEAEKPPIKKPGRQKADRTKAIEAAAKALGQNKRTVQRAVAEAEGKTPEPKEKLALLANLDTFDLELAPREEQEIAHHMVDYEKAASALGAIKRLVVGSDMRGDVIAEVQRAVDEALVMVDANRPTSLCPKCKAYFYEACDLCLGKRVVGRMKLVGIAPKLLLRGAEAHMVNDLGKVVKIAEPEVKP